MNNLLTVLLVDDEEIICRGMLATVPWAENGFRPIGTAPNGAQALRILAEQPVDIVITDVRMPVMDGLSLIRHAQQAGSSARFILLTGYGEFAYASTAMQYGVRHYILKPCKEPDILQALHEVAQELLAQREQERVVAGLQERLSRLTPQAAEQFLSGYLAGGYGSTADQAFFGALLGGPEQPLRVAVLQTGGEADGILQFSLKYIGEELLAPRGVFAAVAIQMQTALITGLTDMAQLLPVLEKLQDACAAYLKQPLAISVSERCTFGCLPAQYQQALRNMAYRFYLCYDSIITPQLAANFRREPGEAFSYRFDLADARLQMGGSLPAEIGRFFHALEQSKPDKPALQEALVEFYLLLLRHVQRAGGMGFDATVLTDILRLDTLRAQRERFSRMAAQVKEENGQYQQTLQSSLLARIRQIVRENLGNPALSLKWIAKNKLFMNEDYLSKLFARQTGEHFSHFVTCLRVEEAKRQLAGSEIRIVDLAQQLGFENNVSYFSTVFKNYTGLTPGEYRKSRAAGD